MAKYERYYDPEVLARISRLELRARMVVEGVITGMHKSPYHGQSVEFADNRAYVPGDDPRHIDWKVYGRADRFVIKKFEEETNLRAHLILDCSESMAYGSTGGDQLTKFDYAATLAASLAYILHRQHDGISLTLFDTEIRDRVPLSSNASVLHWIGNAVAERVPAAKTEINRVFRQIADDLPRRGVVFVISDLFCPRDEIRSALEEFVLRGHDLVVFHVLDETELTFPFEGNTLFHGLEGYPEVTADPRSLRDAYIEAVSAYINEVERIASSLGIDYRRAHTGEPFEAVLIPVIASRLRARRNR